MKEKKMKKDKKEKRQKEDKKEDADEESMMKTESEDKHKKGNKPNNESNLGLNKDSVKISKDAKKNSVAEVWASEQQEHHKSQKKFLDSRSVANPKTKSGDGHLKLKIRALKDPREPASYLKLWNTERSLWKFNKNLQNWLLTNMYDASKVDDDSFALLVSYCKQMKGGARVWAEKDSKLVIEVADKLEGDQEKEGTADAAARMREIERMRKRKERAETLLNALA